MYDAKNDYKPFAGINKLEGGVYSVDYANKSNIIAFAGGSGVLYLIDTSAKIWFAILQSNYWNFQVQLCFLVFVVWFDTKSLYFFHYSSSLSILIGYISII